MLKSEVRDLSAQLVAARAEANAACSDADAARNGADSARRDAQQSIEDVEHESHVREASLQAALHDMEVEARLLRAELKRKDEVSRQREVSLQSALERAQRSATMLAQGTQSEATDTATALERAYAEIKRAKQTAEKNDQISRGLMRDLKKARSERDNTNTLLMKSEATVVQVSSALFLYFFQKKFRLA